MKLWLVIVVTGLTALAMQPRTRGKKADPNALMLSITINGETFDVAEGDESSLRLAKPAGEKLAVRVQRKPIQTYRMSMVTFDYDVRAAIDDDHDVEFRQVAINDPSGAVAFVTEIGEVEPNLAEARLRVLTSDLARGIKRGNVEDFKVTDPRPVKLAHVEGLRQTMSYLDVDGDPNTYHVYLLSGETSMVSMQVSYYSGTEEAGERMHKLLRDSITIK